MERAIEQAQAGDDYHLVSRIRTLLREVEEGHEDINERFEEKMPETDELHPLVEAVPPLKLWIKNNDYRDGAQPALDHLESAFQQGRENENHNIAVFAGERLLRLQLSLGEDAEETFQDIVDFLETGFQGKDIRLGNFHSLLDLIVEHSDRIDDGLLGRCIDVCVDRREIQHNQGNYRGERDTLRQIIELKTELDQDIEQEQKLLVKSFQEEIDRRPDSQGEGAILKEAIVVCKEFLSDEKK